MMFNIQKSRNAVSARTNRWSMLAVVLGLLVGFSNSVVADNAGITVMGSGNAKGKPSEVEITATVSGEAELTNDAMVKFRDAKKRALAAIETLKIKDLTIEPAGISVGQVLDANAQQMMMQGRGGNVGKPKIQVTENLKIIIKNVDKLETGVLMDTMMKVIDTGRDAGLQVGPALPSNYYQYQQYSQAASMLQFKIVDAKLQREEAYKQAMSDAKSRAQRLADLAGVKLGAIISIHDAPATPQQQAYNPYGVPMPHSDSDADLTNQLLGDIPLKVTLTVQFEIQK